MSLVSSDQGRVPGAGISPCRPGPGLESSQKRFRGGGGGATQIPPPPFLGASPPPGAALVVHPRPAASIIHSSLSTKFREFSVRRIKSPFILKLHQGRKIFVEFPEV